MGSLTYWNTKFPSPVLDYWITVGFSDIPSSPGLKTMYMLDACLAVGLGSLYSKWSHLSGLKTALWAFIICTDGQAECEVCSKPLFSSQSLHICRRKQGRVCSKKCAHALIAVEDPDHVKRRMLARRATCEAEYGGPTASSSKAVTDKQSKSLKARWLSDGEAITLARRTTNLDRHGDPSGWSITRREAQSARIVAHFADPSVAAKRVESVRKAYADPKRRRSISKKSKDTFSSRNNGVDCWQHLPDAAETLSKSAAARGRLKVFSKYGREWKLQGSEPSALEYLVQLHSVSSDCVEHGSAVPRFEYTLKRNRFYYPDFFLNTKNIIVEVKSPYTAYGIDGHWRMLKAKSKAVLAGGYKFCLIMVSGTRIRHLFFSPTTTLTEVKGLLRI